MRREDYHPKVILTTALFAEAKPIIRSLSLRRAAPRCLTTKRFQLFEGRMGDLEVSLVITGTGKIKASAAVAACIVRHSSPEVAVLNVGICGNLTSDTQNFSTGDGVLINKVVDGSTLHSFFPDILFRHQFLEAGIVTVDRPIIDGRCQFTSLIDMEASGFAGAASIYLPPHKISLFKVISDLGNQERLCSEFVSSSVAHHVENILLIAQFMAELGIKPVLDTVEEECLEALFLRFRFTESQTFLVRNMARYAKLRGFDLCSFASLMLENTKIPSTSHQVSIICRETIDYLSCKKEFKR